MLVSIVCEHCDGGHHSEDHKGLGILQAESAYANSQLPKEEQSPVHFQGYYPRNNYFCQDSNSAKSVSHLGLNIYQELVNCDQCIEVANKELEVYRDNCYCKFCFNKRKEEGK